MSRQIKETTIGGVNYKFRSLGAETMAKIGYAMVQAVTTKIGIDAVLMRMTKTFVEDKESKVQIETGAWVPLYSVYDDWFAGDKAADFGEWMAWATNESGLANFLAGSLRRMAPEILARLKSIFLSGPSGSSTDSSSPSDSPSPPEPS